MVMVGRLSSDEAVAALMRSGTAAGDEEILRAVPVWRRGRVRRRAEQARLTGALWVRR